MLHAEQIDPRRQIGGKGQAIYVTDLIAKLARDQIVATRHQPARLMILLRFGRLEIAHPRVERNPLPDRRRITRLIGLRLQM